MRTKTQKAPTTPEFTAKDLNKSVVVTPHDDVPVAFIGCEGVLTRLHRKAGEADVALPNDRGGVAVHRLPMAALVHRYAAKRRDYLVERYRRLASRDESRAQHMAEELNKMWHDWNVARVQGGELLERDRRLEAMARGAGRDFKAWQVGEDHHDYIELCASGAEPQPDDELSRPLVTLRRGFRHSMMTRRARTAEELDTMLGGRPEGVTDVLPDNYGLNWPSFGEVSPETALAFGEALVSAAKWALSMMRSEHAMLPSQQGVLRMLRMRSALEVNQVLHGLGLEPLQDDELQLPVVEA